MGSVEQSLLRAPLFATYGLRILLIEIVLFLAVFIYLRKQKRKTSSLVIIAVVVMALTLIASFVGMYLSVTPAYNLTQ